jgi:predicted Fe-Mo cluster-binding NifX family protein
MKIAVSSEDGVSVTGHAGQGRRWLVYEAEPGRVPGPPKCIELARDQIFHHFSGDKPHPLDGVNVIVATSAGDGFLRRMRKLGVEVVLTSEKDTAQVASGVLSGKPLPERRWDLLQYVCKLRDLFSRH